ncbi:MAG TPA: sulfite exporter TauE/SafE family protein [Flavobacteriaceae bacterium]|nr:sulfite exporter TauE/SafE family protein [Flavobacteriaceae bacterium]
MEIIGYIASIAIGLSLGLIGGGGSILTVPVLVYFFGVSPVLATAYSLFIVGATSLIGVFPKYKQGFVSLRTTIVFGIPSIIAVFLTRKFLVPAIPENLGIIGSLEISKSLLVMLLFATLMLAASISMIRSKKTEIKATVSSKKFNYPLILLEGIVVGILTGLVGAGGGFLIIPALVMLGNLPMKKAIGTSLFIIALKSLIGFLGDLTQESQIIDWQLLLIVSGLAVIGIFIGNSLSNKIEGKKLKKGFGWFVLIMGVYIILKELL